MSDKQVTRVRDVMKSKVDVIDGRMTILEALKTMKHIENKSLIVDKRHDDDEYGLLLLSDIAKQVLANDRSPERVNVYEIMSKPVIDVRADMDIRYCARMFEHFGLTRAPVIEDGKVVGMVSYTDMVLKGIANLPE